MNRLYPSVPDDDPAAGASFCASVSAAAPTPADRGRPATSEVSSCR